MGKGINLRKDNPYSSGSILVFPNGSKALTRENLVYRPNIKDELHVLTQFDTLANLAFTKYKSSKYWWIISDINKIPNPFIMEDAQGNSLIGTAIVLPDFSALQANQL